MNDFDLFSEKRKEFLNFLKTRYKLYHSSNVFFRDLHYGVMTFLDLYERKHTYSGSEQLTEKVVASYVTQGILLKVANQAYVLNYPEFKKPPVKQAAPAAPARPAAAKPAAPAPGSAAAPSSASGVPSPAVKTPVQDATPTS